MAFPDLEDVINAASAQLQGSLKENLATVDARKATPLHPKPPAQWIFGDMTNLPQMPCVLVTGHSTKQTQDHHGWRVQEYQLFVEAYYQDSDVQQLSRIMRRYGAAIDHSLRQDNTLGGIAQNISKVSQEYWDTMSAKTGLFQSCRVTFSVMVKTN